MKNEFLEREKYTTWNLGLVINVFSSQFLIIIRGNSHKTRQWIYK